MTGAPMLRRRQDLYVPVSSIEEAPAAQPSYECCTFRGSVVALEAATGEQLWKSYTITEAPHPDRQELGRARAQYAPAGAAVWNSPTHRSRRRACSTSAPATPYTGPAVEDERLGHRDGSQDRQDSSGGIR